MDTSKMALLEKLTSNKTFELYEIAQTLGGISQNLNRTLESSFLRAQIVEVVETLYDLGRVVEVYEIFGGYINRSFGIVVEENGNRSDYFLRKYKHGITEQEVRFEHKLIKHAIDRGLTIAADLIPANDGNTYVKPAISRNLFAVYDFLYGEDKYTWDNPTCSDQEYASAAEVLATFHSASRDFDPEGLERVEPKILELLPTLPGKYKEYARLARNTKFHNYYLNNLEEILKVIETSQIPSSLTARMPLNPIHCDFHPGNLKFSDNKAVGLFDFDWSKIDLRLFDVALALAYFCSSWIDQQDGHLLLDKCAIFLRSYQHTLARLDGLQPLTELELEHLPTMLAAANMYLINWDVSAYYAGTDLNEYEYLAYLQHNVRLMKWIENHKGEIRDMLQTL